MPALTITELGDRVRLSLGGLAHGEGASLQDAADDLVRSILRLVLALRSNGFGVSRELCPDLETINYLHKLGEIAAGGGDIRAHVF
jgi:hypothetical protein